MVTSVIKSLEEALNSPEINVITDFPEIFKGYVCTVNERPGGEFVNLNDYLEQLRPHQDMEVKHLYKHLISLASLELGLTLSESHKPEIILTDEEREWAKGIASIYESPIWVHTKTNSPNKDWIEGYWNASLEEIGKNHDVIDLSDSVYTIRQAIAVTKECKGGIVLDNFLLHGSAAVNAENVLVLLGSSRKGVVDYSSQKAIYIDSGCSVQPCGMHGYGFGCRKEDEYLFGRHEETVCITDDYRCMKAVEPGIVISNFNSV